MTSVFITYDCQSCLRKRYYGHWQLEAEHKKHGKPALQKLRNKKRKHHDLYRSAKALLRTTFNFRFRNSSKTITRAYIELRKYRIRSTCQTIEKQKSHYRKNKNRITYHAIEKQKRNRKHQGISLYNTISARTKENMYQKCKQKMY
jgi:hypothetical protein